MLTRMFRSLGWCSLATVAVTSPAAVVIEDFKAEAVSLNWQIVNDSVMGGISTSQMLRVSDEVVRFSGELSLDNNGGFASVRATGRMPDLAGDRYDQHPSKGRWSSLPVPTALAHWLARARIQR